TAHVSTACSARPTTGSSPKATRSMSRFGKTLLRRRPAPRPERRASRADRDRLTRFLWRRKIAVLVPLRARGFHRDCDAFDGGVDLVGRMLRHELKAQARASSSDGRKFVEIGEETERGEASRG